LKYNETYNAVQTRGSSLTQKVYIGHCIPFYTTQNARLIDLWYMQVLLYHKLRSYKGVCYQNNVGKKISVNLLSTKILTLSKFHMEQEQLSYGTKWCNIYNKCLLTK